MPTTLVAFDWAIKEILRDKANFDILSGLLTELLGKQVVVQELLESESNKDGEYDKSNRITRRFYCRRTRRGICPFQ